MTSCRAEITDRCCCCFKLSVALNAPFCFVACMQLPPSGISPGVHFRWRLHFGASQYMRHVQYKQRDLKPPPPPPSSQGTHKDLLQVCIKPFLFTEHSLSDRFLPPAVKSNIFTRAETPNRTISRSHTNVTCPHDQKLFSPIPTHRKVPQSLPVWRTVPRSIRNAPTRDSSCRRKW